MIFLKSVIHEYLDIHVGRGYLKFPWITHLTNICADILRACLSYLSIGTDTNIILSTPTNIHLHPNLSSSKASLELHFLFLRKGCWGVYFLMRGASSSTAENKVQQPRTIGNRCEDQLAPPWNMVLPEKRKSVWLYFYHWPLLKYVYYLSIN